MLEYKVQTAVVMTVFNRPENTTKVLEEVRKVKPSRLYIVADGPRKGNDKDVERIAQTRAVFETIDWDCEVVKLFSDVNMGCKNRSASGYTEVFKNEETAIILEDDCVPCVEFFRFCDEMLERYKDDERIMLISGTNVAQKKYGGFRRGDYSYHFSRLGGIHGWASWSRAWKLFDLQMEQWGNPIVRTLLRKELGNRLYNCRAINYNEIYAGTTKMSSWAYPWSLTRHINSGLAVVPCVNLVSNVGFSDDSTHTVNPKTPAAAIPYGQLEFPLVHPDFVIPDAEYDDIMLELVFGVSKTKWGAVKLWARMVLSEMSEKTGRHKKG